MSMPEEVRATFSVAGPQRKMSTERSGWPVSEGDDSIPQDEACEEAQEDEPRNETLPTGQQGQRR